MTKRKRLFWLITLPVILFLLVAGGSVLAQSTSAVPAMAGVPALQAGEKYGLIAGNINDGGYNQLAWEGLQRAADGC